MVKKKSSKFREISLFTRKNILILWSAKQTDKKHVEHGYLTSNPETYPRFYSGKEDVISETETVYVMNMFVNKDDKAVKDFITGFGESDKPITSGYSQKAK